MPLSNPAWAMSESKLEWERASVRTSTQQCTSPPNSLVTRPKYPPYRETGVAIPLSHCASCGIADYLCYTPPYLSVKMAYRNPKTDLTREVSQKKLASEAYRAIGCIARNSIANRPIVWHEAKFGPPPPTPQKFTQSASVHFLRKSGF